uniref:[heparan sulfate]-glucosamine N-sulfotransferase n=1 Tax=Plectus sambesii TaxID=2011161 RepID=A0A914W2N6_9BILA
MYNYSVAPHHAGVYPVHEPLFEAWRRVWKIRVTCTEEYPHFRPASRRRGFVYKGIMVLPRQTCGLYTHTLLFSAYPGGHAALTKSIQGGEIFFSIIYNPFALFMTHQQNYGNDRLAIYTFENAVRFVNCWTNIKLKWMDPLKMGIAYFQRFPDERTPVWGNPCSDPRHLEILSSDFNCSQLALPNAVIVGPQKTGSTALYAFLKLHPNVQSNVENNVTYEEPQFFGGKAYLNGLDWYLNQFPFDSGVEGQQVLFEKSATYFDSPDAPRQMNALIDEAKLIIILINPAKRAYSWYQHMIAHKDPIALKYSFAQVLAATDNDSERKLWKLRQRCIAPGRYAHHLDRWLEYYSPNRLLIVDGEQLKDDPVPVMNDVQQFLGLPLIDYKQLLKFNEHKGFYCSQAEGNKTKCLGKSKGRGYEPMGAELTDSLAKLYLQDNIALHKMITKMGWRTPRWLQEQLVKLS